MKILIVKMSSLGDVIHTLPFVRILKKNIPDAEIDWVVNENYKELLEGNPDISEIIIFKRKKWLSPFNFFKNLFEIKSFSSYLKSKKYDYVIDLQGLFKSMLVDLMANGKKIIGFSNPREPVSFIYDEKIEGDYQSHAVIRYLSILKLLNIEWKEEDIEFFIPYTKSDIEFVEKSLERVGIRDFEYGVFAPFSRWKTKMLSQDKFKKLAEKFEKAGVPIVFVGDKNEKLTFETQRSLVGVLTLNQLYYLMKKSLFVLTCDSGAMHIASASGTKVFAIFGPTSSERTGPFTKGNNHPVIIRKDNLECAPCLKRECAKGFECMDISEEEIFKIIFENYLKDKLG